MKAAVAGVYVALAVVGAAIAFLLTNPPAAAEPVAPCGPGGIVGPHREVSN